MSVQAEKSITGQSVSDDDLKKIGPYRICRRLGAGAMGTVYEVEHEYLGIRRALKLFRTGGSHADFLRKRFLAEGKLLARLDNPRLVRVHDLAFDENTGAPYFTMDLVVGPDGVPQTFADVQHKGGVAEETLTGWYADLREALDAIHASGIVHRDIKLENILVDNDGHAVLSDFGISRVMDADLREAIALTRTIATGEAPDARRVMGTIMYLAPEIRAGGEPSPASDIWALGMTLFRMLTGLWYEPGANAIDLLEPFNPAWRQLFTALLAIDPSKRSLPQFTLETYSPVRRHWKRLVAGAVLAAGIAGALAFVWAISGRHGDSRDSDDRQSEMDVDVSDAFSVPSGIK